MKKFILFFLSTMFILTAASCSNSSNEVIETLKIQVEQLEKHINQLEVENGVGEIEWSETEIAKKCSGAVFYIESYREDGTCTGNASGFFISEDGLAVSNFHVIDGAAALKVRIKDSDDFLNVIGINYDEDTDIAIIQVEAAAGQKFNYLQLGDIDSVEQGEKVYAIGNPKGYIGTFSAGNVSYVSRSEVSNFIQHTVPISSGSSGSPLLNRYGKVIGVNTSSRLLNISQKIDPVLLEIDINVLSPQLLNFASPISNIEKIKNNALVDISQLQKKLNQAKVVCTASAVKESDGTYTVTVTASGGSGSSKYAIGYGKTSSGLSYFIPVDSDNNPLYYHKFTGVQPGSTWYFGAFKLGDNNYFDSTADVVQYTAPTASYESSNIVPSTTYEPTIGKKEQDKVICSIDANKESAGTYTITVTASGGSGSGKYAIGYGKTEYDIEYFIPVDDDGNPLNFHTFTGAQMDTTYFFGVYKQGDDTFIYSDKDVKPYTILIDSDTQ